MYTPGEIFAKGFPKESLLDWDLGFIGLQAFSQEWEIENGLGPRMLSEVLPTNPITSSV